MISVAICGERLQHLNRCDAVATVELEGMAITFGRVTTPDLTFDPRTSENRSMVFIKVRAFSCNYRDKGLLLAFGRICKANTYCFIGSEFVGEVIAVGSEVAAFRQGDRVIMNNPWPHSGVEGVPPGIPTNHASHRYRVLHERQVLKVPEAMHDAVAAGFSIGAQTVYSMLRKLNPQPGANILVTSARSNTSLFAIQALKSRQVNVYALTSAQGYDGRLREMGVQRVIELQPDVPGLLESPEMRDIMDRTGGFEYVIDPFYDLHLGELLEVMANGATYITCGLADQYSHLTGTAFKKPGQVLDQIMSLVSRKNIHLIGNCLGETADLAQALQDYARGALPVVIDTVFTGSQVGAFIARTYCARERFGKVIYQYD
jgi:NADPH:quinone reductase-like Zn-dependent oxidoreductase